MLTVALVALVVLVTLYHAYLEWEDDALAEWLGNDLGFIAPHWLANGLWLLAVGAILLPLSAVFVFDARVWWVVVGALLGDALLTHILPTIFTSISVPATGTWPLQTLAAICCVIAAWSHGSSWWAVVGFAEFIPLRASLRLLMNTRWLKTKYRPGLVFTDALLAFIIVVGTVLGIRAYQEYISETRAHAACLEAYVKGNVQGVDPEAWCQP